MVSRRQHQSIGSLPEHLAKLTAAIHLAFSRLRQGDWRSHRTGKGNGPHPWYSADSDHWRPRNFSEPVEGNGTMSNWIELDIVSANAVTRGHPQTAATIKATPWTTSHRPKDTTQMHRKRGDSGRQLPQAPATTRIEHRVWWVGQKFSRISDTDSRGATLLVGLSLKLKGVSELNDIK